MQPNFHRSRTAVLCQGELDRVPLAEASIDTGIWEAVLGRPIRGPQDEVNFWAQAGYDFVPVHTGLRLITGYGFSGEKEAASEREALLLRNRQVGRARYSVATDAELRRITHKTIRTCTEHMEGFRFNVYLAALMEYTKHLVRLRETPVAHTEAWREAERTLVLLLAPITPHLAEELWARLGEPYSVHQQRWPAWSEELAADVVITLVVQINGKVRDRLEVPADISAEDAKALALASDGAKRHVNGKQVQDVIYVPGRLANIVVR